MRRLGPPQRVQVLLVRSVNTCVLLAIAKGMMIEITLFLRIRKEKIRSKLGEINWKKLIKIEKEILLILRMLRETPMGWNK